MFSHTDILSQPAGPFPNYFFFFLGKGGMRHAPSRLSADVEDSIRARQVGLKPLDGSALCPTP